MNLSLPISGALHLQVHPDTPIISTRNDAGEKILYNDNQWHKVKIEMEKSRFTNWANVGILTRTVPRFSQVL